MLSRSMLCDKVNNFVNVFNFLQWSPTQPLQFKPPQHESKTRIFLKTMNLGKCFITICCIQLQQLRSLSVLGLFGIINTQLLVFTSVRFKFIPTHSSKKKKSQFYMQQWSKHSLVFAIWCLLQETKHAHCKTPQRLS